MITTYDFQLFAGSDQYVRVNLVDQDSGDVDLTGYTANMQVRKSYNAVKVDDRLTVDNGRIVVGDTYLELHFSNKATSDMRQGRFIYDLELVNPQGLISRILQGSIEIIPEVTRIE